MLINEACSMQTGALQGIAGSSINSVSLLRAAAALQAVPGLTLAQQEHIYSLFDKYVDGGLAWVRKQGKEYIPSVDNNLTSTLMLLLQVRS
jgi:hypothetical protein